MAGFGAFAVKSSDGEVLSVPIGRDARLILARRVDTWVDPYVEQVGCGGSELCVFPDSFLLSLTTPDCIRGDPFFHLSFFLSY